MMGNSASFWNVLRPETFRGKAVRTLACTFQLDSLAVWQDSNQSPDRLFGYLARATPSPRTMSACTTRPMLTPINFRLGNAPPFGATRRARFYRAVRRFDNGYSRPQLCRSLKALLPLRRYFTAASGWPVAAMRSSISRFDQPVTSFNFSACCRNRAGSEAR
jgi:hypothetical protein